MWSWEWQSYGGMAGWKEPDPCGCDPVFLSARLKKLYPVWFWVSSPQSKSRCYWSDFCLCPWQQWDSAISFSIGDGVAVGWWGWDPSMNRCWCQRPLVVRQGPPQVKFSTWDIQRARVRLQLVKDFPRRHNELTSDFDLQNRCENSGLVAHAYNPSTGS